MSQCTEAPNIYVASLVTLIATRMTLSGSYVLLMLLILLDSETTIPPFTRGSLLSMKTTRVLVLVLVCFCVLPRPHFLFDASAAMDPRHPALFPQLDF
jgi:hypothetical protein